MTSYLERFQSAADVQAYDEAEYGADSYSSFIWNLQQPILRGIVETHRARHGKVRLLDFACGTGRILSFVEGLVEESVGVDLSPNMIGRAEQRCRKSRLIVGDIVADSRVAGGCFEIITAFRFLLNAEGAVRLSALRALRARINDEHGILIANVHGNAFSARHLAIKYRRWRLARGEPERLKATMLSELGRAEIVDILRAGGFDVGRIVGFGLVPQFLYRTPAARFAKGIDRLFAARSLTKAFSIDLLLVCTPGRKI